MASLEKTVAWYHGVLGLHIARKPSRWSFDRAESAVTGVRALSRSVVIDVPNESFKLRFTQYRGVAAAPTRPNSIDIGSTMLTFSVKDAVTAYAALRAANTPTLLEGGTIPDGTGTGTITVFVRDPDGMPVEVVQRSGPADYFTVDPPTITNGPGMRYIIRGQMDFTVLSDTAALTFYRDLLGFDINPGFSFLVGPNEHPVIPPFLADLFGIAHGSTWAAATGNCASEVRCEFFEYDDPARIIFDPAVTTPGAPMLDVTTTDLRALLVRLQAAGIQVVTPAGRPVRVGHNLVVLVRDTSGLLVRLEQRICAHV